jgi:hypothetical protein
MKRKPRQQLHGNRQISEEEIPKESWCWSPEWLATEDEEIEWRQSMIEAESLAADRFSDANDSATLNKMLATRVGDELVAGQQQEGLGHVFEAS